MAEILGRDMVFGGGGGEYTKCKSYNFIHFIVYNLICLQCYASISIL
jgi:hypothetical protein